MRDTALSPPPTHLAVRGYYFLDAHLPSQVKHEKCMQVGTVGNVNREIKAIRLLLKGDVGVINHAAPDKRL